MVRDVYLNAVMELERQRTEKERAEKGISFTTVYNGPLLWFATRRRLFSNTTIARNVAALD